MRVSYRWLQEFVPVELPPEELAERLTLVGLAVEAVERPWRHVEGVVAGRVTAVERHPASDHLKVVRVETGGAALTIVTGAPNARAGMLVPVALPGARLADGRRIAAADFRGVVSEGMCCSADELALPEPPGPRGLLELDPQEGWRPGMDVARALELDDAVLEVELTPNYAAHCQSVLGVAREVAALLELPLLPAERRRGPSQPAPASWPADRPRPPRVFIEDEGCARYVARFILDVRVGPSPLWLQRRLQAAGMRPISNVVDVTNYVMLETGQPLHAFDLDTLRGGLIGARAARPGETLRTLDGEERRLQEGDLVIADAEAPVALAGVMGGAATEVTERTRSILLESAWFDPARVGRTARRLGLLSEASGRFEKGVDPSGCRWVADRAAALIQALAGGTVPEEVEDAYPRPARPRRLEVEAARIRGLLGVDLGDAEIASYLRRLHMDVRAEGGRLVVTVPTFRPDVTEPVDLVEEVGRLYGLNRIPSAPLHGAPGRGGRSARRRALDELSRLMRAAGFTEAVTFTFHPEERLARLGLPPHDERSRPIAVANPLSEAQEVMRTTMLPSLLDVLAHNHRVRRTDAALFEIARVYMGADEVAAGRLPQEPLRLAFVASGRLAPRHWREGEGRAADFFTAKGVVEAVLRLFRVEDARWERAREPFLHPGRAAYAAAGGRALGWVGELHPRVAAAWDLEGRVVAAELDVEALLAAGRALPELRPLPRFPAVARDLALVVDLATPAAEVERVMRQAGGELLRSIELFDVYAGERLGAGRRSLAYRLVYQADDRTLTEDEVEAVHGRVRQALAGELGAVLRS
ncbi:MAG: phenylalanine--tRNA ligase subunit beta [Firmicutes bacterium]|nr:phenylalanine--tRNA ligase subunit beta [Bacillota bacterium]